MMPLPSRRDGPEDVVPLAEYLEPCIRWGYVFYALAQRAQLLGRWDIAERFRSDGEFIFEALDKIAEQEMTT
jgi:hypothetical protein